MSNQTVGNIYQQVIKDVIESSRVDFEEGGVDESVLEELSKGWQKKLSALAIAQFPWDPKPDPTPAPTAPPPQQPMQNVNYQPQDMHTPPSGMQQTNIALPNMATPTIPQMNSGPRIKPEPGLDGNGITAPPQTFQPPEAPLPSGLTPQQRASYHLHNRYGPRANASINALQSGMPQPTQGQQAPQSQQSQQQQQQQQQPPQQQQQQQQNNAGQQPMQRPQMNNQQSQQQYQQAMANQAALQRQRAQAHQAQGQSQNGVSNAQTDGAGDETFGVLNRVNANGEVIELGRVEIDNMIRQRIESMGRTMEGGGLMLPLKQHAPSGKSRQRKVVPATGEASSSIIPQMDGVDSDDDVKHDEDFDEDAINSDLDDPDDGLNEDDEEDGDMGNVMLCMYDKVHRTKNKWKCVMKDGVITINNKEYVFHKASGEYEW